MAELQAGEIKHALAVDIPGYGLPGAACAYNNWRLPNDMGVTPIAYPAQRGDGTYFGPDCIPEGGTTADRTQLQPQLAAVAEGREDVRRRRSEVPEWIVRDRDAGGVSFFAEDSVSLRRLACR